MSGAEKEAMFKKKYEKTKEDYIIELAHARELLRLLELEGAGKNRCKQFTQHCAHCMFTLFHDLLDDHIELIKDIVDEWDSIEN